MAPNATFEYRILEIAKARHLAGDGLEAGRGARRVTFSATG